MEHQNDFLTYSTIFDPEMINRRVISFPDVSIIERFIIVFA